MVGAVKQEKQAGQNRGGVGQLPFPLLSHGQNQSVRQGEHCRQRGQGVHAHPPPERSDHAGHQHIQRQQNPRPQQSDGDPHLNLILIQRRKPHKAGGRHSQLYQGGGSQQKNQDDPQAHPIQPLPVPAGQLLRSHIRGRRLRPAGAAEPAGGLRGLVFLHIGAGNQLFQTVDLLRVHLFRLLKHVVGIVFRLMGNIFEESGQDTLFLRKRNHPAVGLFLILGLILAARRFFLELRGLEGLPTRFSLLLLLFLRLRRRSGAGAGEGHYVIAVITAFRLFCPRARRQRHRCALGFSLGSVLRQNVLYGKRAGVCIANQRFELRQVILVQLFRVTVTHGRLLGSGTIRQEPVPVPPVIPLQFVIISVYSPFCISFKAAVRQPPRRWRTAS